VNVEGELDKIHNRTRPDAIGERYRRPLAPVDPSVGPGGDRYAKIWIVFDEYDVGWVDFATNGFPSHYEAYACKADGTLVSATSKLHLLGAPDPKNDPSGLICEVNDIVLYRPLDGTLTVPGDAATVLDGVVLAGLSAGRFYPKVID